MRRAVLALLVCGFLAVWAHAQLSGTGLQTSPTTDRAIIVAPVGPLSIVSTSTTTTVTTSTTTTTTTTTTSTTTTTTTTTTTSTTTTTLVATVTVGPLTCAGGSNNGTECFHDANCTGGGTCTGAAHTTFLDQVSGNSTTTVAAGTRVDFVWLATGVNHDIAGGTECTNGGTSGSPTNRACDPGDGVCVGGSNVNGNCGDNTDCPGGTCDLNKECRYCTGGANDGHLCPFDLGCTGGGTCSHASTCTNTLADTWDAGGSFMAPHTTSHLFTIAGTYPYVCSIHYNASTPMLGTVVVTP